MEHIMKEIGTRLRDMREIAGLSLDELAACTGVTAEMVAAIEAGSQDFSFSYVYQAARRLGIDLTELLTGESPHLTSYTLVRRDEGLPIERRAGFRYQNLAPYFRGRLCEPLLVQAPYDERQSRDPIALGRHHGQEMDYILSGSLRIQIGQHIEILHEGDAIYYDSGRPHGMVAVDGPCRFLALVISEMTSGQEDKSC